MFTRTTCSCAAAASLCCNLLLPGMGRIKARCYSCQARAAGVVLASFELDRSAAGAACGNFVVCLLHETHPEEAARAAIIKTADRSKTADTSKAAATSSAAITIADSPVAAVLL